MRGKILAMLVMAITMAGVSVLGADTYQIDPVHSNIGFTVKHMVISNVKGNFSDFSGTIVYDDKDISKSSVNVTIKTISINTGNQYRDNDLKSGNFFEAEKYPEITFQSTKIEKAVDGFVMTGNLTMRGVTKEVQIPFNILGTIKDPYGNMRMGAEGGLTINRQDYGISFNKALDNGGLVVGNEVKIDLNIEAVNKKQ
ncbi:conserved exported hypothetical protein [Candidatus Zixiibacteriota bacterium]|nr:conserved exported hypothetical protein [candidate division Zixibacteria bacterium]